MNADIDELSNGLASTLTRHLQRLTAAPHWSTETGAHVAKRIPPRALSKYGNHAGAIRLVGLEVYDLGRRISYYRYIERYRQYFTPPNAEVRAAFVNHTHVLRGAEIYVIMERCSDFLDFFYCVSADLGLDPKKRSGALEKEFKKSFQRHLRERHRIVHAHERPSLASRMISIPPEDLKTAEGMNFYLEAIAKLIELGSDDTLKKIEGMSPKDTMKYFDDIRLRAVDQECADMWSILVDNITKLVDPAKLLR